MLSLRAWFSFAFNIVFGMKKINIEGPFAADTIFLKEHVKKFDLVFIQQAMQKIVKTFLLGILKQNLTP